LANAPPLHIYIPAGARIDERGHRYMRPVPEADAILVKERAQQLLEAGKMVKIGPGQQFHTLGHAFVANRNTALARVVITLPALNAMVLPHAHPAADPLQIAEELSGHQYFYSGDYRRAFDQFSMNAGSERWLTVAWNGELYALLVTPMGLRTSAAHVHQITSLTHDYEDEHSIQRAYADNIQGGVSGDPRHLLQAVRRLLDQARTLGATLTADTLHIGQQELDVLGYTVRPGHVVAQQDKLEALRILAPPQTKADMQHALGVFQWFSNTVAGLGNSPQIRALQAWHRAPRWRQLDVEHRAHFEAAKQMVLTCGTALVRYNPRKDLYYVSDASDVGIAGFAFHLSDCGRHIELVALIAHAWSAAERNYTVPHKELAGLRLLQKRFPELLEASRHILWCLDAEIALYIMTSLLASTIPRIRHTWLELQHLNVTVVHINGKHNGLADALSRNPAFRGEPAAGKPEDDEEIIPSSDDRAAPTFHQATPAEQSRHAVVHTLLPRGRDQQADPLSAAAVLLHSVPTLAPVTTRATANKATPPASAPAPAQHAPASSASPRPAMPSNEAPAQPPRDTPVLPERLERPRAAQATAPSPPGAPAPAAQPPPAASPPADRIRATDLQRLESQYRLDLVALSAAQCADGRLGSICEALGDGSFRQHPRRAVYQLRQGVLMSRARHGHRLRPPVIAVPESMRPVFCAMIHDISGHAAGASMLRVARHICYWPSMARQLDVYARACVACASNRAVHSAGPRGQDQDSITLKATRAGEVLYADIYTPDKVGRAAMGLRDAYDGFTALVPIDALTAKAVLTAYHTFVQQNPGGEPRVVKFDNGPGFAAAEVKSAIEASGLTTCLYNTKGNHESMGMIETRFHQLNKILRAADTVAFRFGLAPASWPEQLMRAAAVINGTPRSDAADKGLSPSELRFGQGQRLAALGHLDGSMLRRLAASDDPQAVAFANVTSFTKALLPLVYEIQNEVAAQERSEGAAASDKDGARAAIDGAQQARRDALDALKAKEGHADGPQLRIGQRVLLAYENDRSPTKLGQRNSGPFVVRELDHAGHRAHVEFIVPLPSHIDPGNELPLRYKVWVSARQCKPFYETPDDQLWLDADPFASTYSPSDDPSGVPSYEQGQHALLAGTTPALRERLRKLYAAQLQQAQQEFQRRRNREAAAAAQQERAAKEQADRQRLQADNAAYRERIAQQSPNEEFVSIQRFTNVDHAVYGTTRGNKESVKRLSDLSSIEKRLFDTFVRTSNGGRL
jgi:hypothetical protein